MGNDWKNAISNTSGRVGSFVKSSRTLRDKVRFCELRKLLNVESLLQIERSQLRLFGHVIKMLLERLSMIFLLSTPKGKRSRGRRGSGAAIRYPTLLGPPWCGANRATRGCWKLARISGALGLLPSRHCPGKAGVK